MTMIRWSGLIAFVIIVGLIAVFNLFFLDGIVERSVEKQASLAVGARVDIGDLDLSLLGLSVDIEQIQVANPDQPMRNTVEVGRLSFDLTALPLLKKKVVIQHMAVTGLAWNTPRKTSGALPPRLLKKQRKYQGLSEAPAAAGKRLEDCVLPDLSILQTLKGGVPEDLLAKTSLPSTEFMASYRERLSQSTASWDQRLDGLPTSKEIESLIAKLRGLADERPKDVSKLPAYLNEMKALQQKLSRVQDTLKQAQHDFQKEAQGLKSTLAMADDLKAKDLKAVWSQLGIHAPSAEDLICVLLGRDLATKVNRALGWYRKLRSFMPAQKADKKPTTQVSPRLKGADIRFPVTRGYPKFLLERAEFSARPDIEGKSGGLAFAKLEGELQGLTSDPAIYGKPMVFGLKGDLTGNRAQSVAMSGELDRRKEPADDRMHLIIKGLRLERTDMESPKARSLMLASAFFDIDGNLRVTGENLNGQVLIGIQKPQVSVGEEAQILAGVFENLGSFDVTLSVSGTLDQPRMGLSSSATKNLAATVQKVFQSQLTGTQQALKQTISARIDKQVLAARDETNTFESSIGGELSSRVDITGLWSDKSQKQKGGSLEGLTKGVLPF